MGTTNFRLNPCFSGICSLSHGTSVEYVLEYGLNPCFSGICSLSGTATENRSGRDVLILVLVEYAL